MEVLCVRWLVCGLFNDTVSASHITSNEYVRVWKTFIVMIFNTSLAFVRKQYKSNIR